MPLLLVCEDNGLGISVPTPPGWIAAMFAGRSGLEYRRDDGRDPLATLVTAREAAEHAREHRMPVLLHLACVRIGGHAGSDVESAYRSAADLAADLERDPSPPPCARSWTTACSPPRRCGCGGRACATPSPRPSARPCGGPS